jgi:hypothetical protein
MRDITEFLSLSNSTKLGRVDASGDLSGLLPSGSRPAHPSIARQLLGAIPG